MTTLALVGGDEFRPGCDPLDLRLIQLAGGGAARVAILPTANHEHPRIAAMNGAQHFERLGARSDSVLVVDRVTAANPELISQLDDATMIYLAGGSPEHLFSVLKDSPVWEAILQAYHRGVVLAGSSAGAMVFAEHIYNRQGSVGPGLGLVPGVVVVPHLERTRDQWLPAIRRVAPAHTILGIDGQSGCIWNGQDWEVGGAGEVVVYRGEASRVYRAGERFRI